MVIQDLEGGIMAQRTREEIMAEVVAAEGEIACKTAMDSLEILLDCRDVLNEIETNTKPSP